MYKPLAVLLAVVGLSLHLAPTRAQAADAKSRAYLGILTEEGKQGSQAGAVVRDVAPDGPAAKAGIKSGDVITKVDDKEVKDARSLTGMIADRKSGDKVTVLVMRDGKEQSFSVTLGDRPGRRVPPVGIGPEGTRGAVLGVQTQELTPELKKRLDVAADGGALITAVGPGTPAEKAGLKADDVITGVDDQSVTGPRQLSDAIRKAGAGKEVTLKVVRGKEKMDVKAKLEEGPVGEIGPFPGFPGGFSSIGPSPLNPREIVENGKKVQDLERKVEELEKRVHELEQKQTPPAK